MTRARGQDAAPCQGFWAGGVTFSEYCGFLLDRGRCVRTIRIRILIRALSGAREQPRECARTRGGRVEGAAGTEGRRKAAQAGWCDGGDSAEPALSAERALIEAAQRDRIRFAELYENNFERVYAYIARRVRDRAGGDRDEAQDLTADVFHLALKNLARFEWRGVPFAAWLFKIASNEIADRSKRVAQRRAHERENIFFLRTHQTVSRWQRALRTPSGGRGCSNSSSGCRGINRG